MEFGSKNEQIEEAMGEINDLIEKIFSMQLYALENENQTCSKIVGELLQNDLIAHVKSLPALKLLIY